MHYGNKTLVKTLARKQLSLAHFPKHFPPTLMASKLFSTIFNNKRNFTKTNLEIFTRAYRAVKPVARNNLYSRISPLGDPDVSLTPVLDQWVLEGQKVSELELQHIIRQLRSRKRFKHALQVSEWMSGQGLTFSVRDRAVQLDLIGKVRGLESAESYFNGLNEEDKVDKLYGALLNCYVREGLVDESLSLMQKMKEMGSFGSALNYNDIMCLYTNTGQHEKIPDVLLDMKDNGVSPDNFSYRICINSYGARSDLSGMENVLQEMESQSHISMDWVTCSTVANYYIKGGLKEKAIIYLQKCEDIVSKSKDALGYNHLISHYASLGNKDEMMKLWGLQKIKCKKQVNRDYITMLGCLVKIGELEEAEKMFEEWESSCYCYDFRVPNIILFGYSQKGMIEKADAMLKEIVKKGKTPTPNSWSIIAAGYADKKNMEKAFECMKEALAVHEENKFWRPKPSLVSSILDWLGDNRDVEEVKAFISSLKIKVQERKMYHALTEAHIRSGQKVDGLLESMKADDIDEEWVNKGDP